MSTLEGRIDSPGHVYNCGGDLEYCYLQDAADELSDLTGLSCRNIEVGDRLAPWLLGCWYHCGEGRGCNAHGGCWCPATMLGHVSLKLWHIDDTDADVCDTEWAKPAIACHGSWVPVYDGCRWVCELWQSETP